MGMQSIKKNIRRGLHTSSKILRDLRIKPKSSQKKPVIKKQVLWNTITTPLLSSTHNGASKPKAIFYTCMDSRMIPTRFTETSVGDMFVVRNAGNLIPHSQYFVDELTSCEPAGLELACVVNNIRNIIVCGHSDCKAINLLYQLRSKEESSLEKRRMSPLKSWMCSHAQSSLDKFTEMNGDFTKPMMFTAETPQRKFVAYIDPENKFCIEDKLSQVNTLQQVQNVASYGMLKKRLEKHDLHIHALWFDIYTGDIYYFSRRAKRFIIIDESTYESMSAEIRRYYS